MKDQSPLAGYTINEIAEKDWKHSKDIVAEMIEQEEAIRKKSAVIDEALGEDDDQK